MVQSLWMMWPGRFLGRGSMALPLEEIRLSVQAGSRCWIRYAGKGFCLMSLPRPIMLAYTDCKEKAADHAALKYYIG